MNYSTQKIANELGLKRSTVSNYRASLKIAPLHAVF